MFEFVFTLDFQQDFQKLEPEIREQIKEKLSFISSSKNPLLFARKLKGYKNIFRFRCGDFRVVFYLEKNRISLLMVKHRREIYLGL